MVESQQLLSLTLSHQETTSFDTKSSLSTSPSPSEEQNSTQLAHRSKLAVHKPVLPMPMSLSAFPVLTAITTQVSLIPMYLILVLRILSPDLPSLALSPRVVQGMVQVAIQRHRPSPSLSLFQHYLLRHQRLASRVKSRDVLLPSLLLSSTVTINHVISVV